MGEEAQKIVENRRQNKSDALAYFSGQLEAMLQDDRERSLEEVVYAFNGSLEKFDAMNETLEVKEER